MSATAKPDAVLLPAGGLNVSLGAVFANVGLLGVLFAAKMVPKLGLVLPPARREPFPTRTLHIGPTGASAPLSLRARELEH